MVRLAWLAERLGGTCDSPALDESRSEGPRVLDVQLDSRRVSAGDLFVALPGEQVDGARFAGDAAARGAVAVLTPHELDRRAATLPQWVHPEARAIAGRAAALVHGEPARDLAVAGITGTNGKTTVAHLLGHLLVVAGLEPAVLGTAGHRLAGRGVVPASHTTPDGPELQRLLRAHRDAGGKSVAMEVSSHALLQERTAGIDFDVGVFTNLSREHLDYHGDMDRYARAKALLFEQLGSRAAAVLNIDDPAWGVMEHGARQSGARVVTYSTRSHADLCAAQLRTGLQGSLFVLDGMGIKSTELRLPLRGRYNVDNALAAAAAARLMGASPSAIVEGLATTSPAPGRLEPVPTGERGFALYVDYAHSPGALENVLRALRSELDSEPGGGRLVLVFGCGGDRDAGKRPEMGRIAARLADVAIVTSDNPRNEDPRRIVDEIVQGMQGGAEERIEVDRRRAIEMAIDIARPGDIVLVAGRGCETSQLVEGEAVEFDDRLVAREALT